MHNPSFLSNPTYKCILSTYILMLKCPTVPIISSGVRKTWVGRDTEICHWPSLPSDGSVTIYLPRDMYITAARCYICIMLHQEDYYMYNTAGNFFLPSATATRSEDFSCTIKYFKDSVYQRYQITTYVPCSAGAGLLFKLNISKTLQLDDQAFDAIQRLHSRDTVGTA